MFNLLEVVAGSTVGLTDIQGIIDAVTSQISITGIVGILVGGIGVAIGFVFFYWGARKLIGIIMNAFKKGKLSV